jgi:hypothetical protein
VEAEVPGVWDRQLSGVYVARRQPSLRDSVVRALPPKVETLGYFRASLRDWVCGIVSRGAGLFSIAAWRFTPSSPRFKSSLHRMVEKLHFADY